MTGRSDRLGRLADVALIAAALVIAVSVAWREWRATRSPAPAAVGKVNEYLPDWERMLSVGLWVGDRNAPVKVVVFVDLECPACRQFHAQWLGASPKVRSSTALVVVHLPLPQHRFARQAARALECADRTGHAGPLMDVVFEKQDSLGLKRWTSYADEAGIELPHPFEECVMGSAPFPRIDAGLAMGTEIGVTGTPTVIVNGWRYARAGDFAATMDQAVEAVLHGDSPFDARPARRGLP